MKHVKSFKMYDHPVMELLSRSGPRMMITFHSILIFFQLYLAALTAQSLLTSAALFISGIFSWTLAEYVLHRWLFHFKNNHPWIKAFHFAMHGYHHKVPEDAGRLFMPPIPAHIFLSLFWVIFHLLMGSKVWCFLPGFELGYLLYSFVHFSIHSRKAPKGFERLWHHHLVHHYKEPERAFGVSSVFWDWAFKTMPEKLR